MKQRKRLSKIPNVVRPYVKDLEASHQVKISCFFDKELKNCLFLVCDLA